MNSRAILGFSGKIGSGKTSLSYSLATNLGWPYTSFSSYVKIIAKEKKLIGNRKELQEIGENLVKNKPEEFCKKVLELAKWSKGESLVIDGIRHIQILEIIKRLVAPNTFYLIFVDLDDTIISERIKLRDPNINFRASNDLHSTEIQVEGILKHKADLIVNNILPIDIQVKNIIQWIEKK